MNAFTTGIALSIALLDVSLKGCALQEDSAPDDAPGEVQLWESAALATPPDDPRGVQVYAEYDWECNNSIGNALLNLGAPTSVISRQAVDFAYESLIYRWPNYTVEFRISAQPDDGCVYVEYGSAQDLVGL